MLQYIFSFIILISIVVFIHEYGHYYFAKKYKVGVTDFSIGFGKELFGFNDKDGTRWKFCIIPLGGYVKFFGDSNAASQPKSISKIDVNDRSKLLSSKPLYQRAIIVSAGPIANFLLAIIIFATIFITVGKDITLPVISEVRQDSPADLAGLKSNDQITFIDKKKNSYLKNNIIGTTNIVKISNDFKVEKFIFASTAAVYKYKNINLTEKDKLKAAELYCEMYDLCRNCGSNKHFINSCKNITMEPWVLKFGGKIQGTRNCIKCNINIDNLVSDFELLEELQV